MDISAEKKRLREAVTERLSHRNEQARSTESRTICKRILQQLPKEPIIAAVYYPMKSEVDILPLIQTLLEKGSTLFMSRAEGKSFEFRQVTALSALVPGPFRIPEPTAESPLLDTTTLQYVLVPGMAFDRSGHRLGRGSGGYDKWLAGVRTVNPNVHVFGIALECQIVNEVPVVHHDQPMDKVITARETFIAHTKK